MKHFFSKSFWVIAAIFLLLNTRLAAQVAGFAVDDSSGCGSLTAIFQDTSNVPAGVTAVSWDWDFGDNSFHSTLKNPAHIYTGLGCYTVSMTVVYDNGLTFTITKPNYACVHDYPLVNATVSSAVGCTPFTVQLCDASIANGDSMQSWIWDIPTTPIGNDSCEIRTLTNLGTYDVTLIVTNNFGCTSDSTFNDLFSVSESPEVNFIAATNPSTCNQPPLTLDFVNQTILGSISNPTGVNYNWSFPGATSPNPPTSTSPAPTGVTYSNVGNYDVQLIATVAATGCADTLIRDAYVSIGPIQADFTVPSTLCVGEPFTLTNSTQGGANFYRWDRLCDGTINNQGASGTVTYTFPTAGTYCVKMIALNTVENCKDSITKNIVVNPAPNAHFVADRPQDCAIPSIFTFSNQSTTGGGGQATYSWDFGSAATPPTTVINNTSAQNVTYNAAGNQNVTLTVINSFGCSDDTTANAIVKIIPPVANFNAIKREGCVPFTGLFTSSASPNIAPYTPYTYEWIVTPAVGITFLPNNTVANPQIIFNNAGTYEVSLVIFTPGGCNDTITKTNYIKTGDIPIFDFLNDKDTTCVRQEVQFNSVPNNPSWSYSWDFNYNGGFSSQSSLPDPLYAYVDTGFFHVALVVYNNGCRDTLVKDSLIYIKVPKADFTLDPTTSCTIPVTVSFLDNSIAPGGCTYSWNYGNNFTSTSPTPTSQTYSPALTGTFPMTIPVKLIVSDIANGCVDSVTRNVIIGHPVSSFTIADSIICRNAANAASFTNTSINSSSYSWFFGDPTPMGVSADLSPQYTYSDLGTFTVKLIATDANGCVDSTTNTIRVTGPLANFSSTDTLSCAPVTINFTNATTLYPGTSLTSINWNFGVGSPPSTSTLPNPSYTYTTIGTPNVTLTVTDSDGCIGVKSIPFGISNPSLSLIAQGNDTILCRGDIATLKSTITSAAYPVSYVWNYGDGSALNNTTSSTSLNTVTHQYFYGNAPYTVTLSAVDANGCTADITKTDFIRMDTVIADFTADVTYSPCPNPPIVPNFFNTSTSSAGTVTSYSWNFGDAIPPSPIVWSTLPNPGHAYTYADSFDVTLIVKDSRGCKDTAIKQAYIIIGGPYGTYKVSPQLNCPGDSVCFEIITRNTDVIQIDFGGASLGVVVLPVIHSGAQFDTTTYCAKYNVPGTYTPIVKIVKGNCQYIIPSNKTVKIFTAPTAQITASALSGCIPLNLNLQDNSIQGGTPTTPAAITGYAWSIPGGAPATGNTASISTVYATANSYPIQLIVTDVNGCKDTTSISVTAFDKPHANFYVAPDSFGCAPFKANFFDATTGTIPTSWSWQFGDGGVSTAKDPLHNYLVNGLYDVTLVAADANGCKDSLTKPQFMKLRKPTAFFIADSVIGCTPFTVNFDASGSQSDTAITLYTWVTNSQTLPFNAPNDSLQYSYTDGGIYDVTLSVTDAFGCSDTFSRPQYINVALAGIPDSVVMKRATVEGPQKVKVEYKQYPFADFRAYFLMRYDQGLSTWIAVDSSFNIATLVLYDTKSDLSCENFPYKYTVLVENFCRKRTPLPISQKHTTISLGTQPLIDNIKLSWTPYQGWDTVLMYNIYSSDKYSYNLNDYSLIASLSSTTYKFQDLNTFCSDSIYYRIEAVQYVANGNGATSWSDVSGNAPIHNPSAQNMGITYATVEADSFVNVKWGLYTGYKPDKYLIEKSFDGVVWKPLKELPLTTYEYDDFNVEVDSASYYYRVFALDKCGDRSRVGYVGKTILVKATQDWDETPILNWTTYKQWGKGVQYYEIEVLDELLGWKKVDIVSGATSVSNLTYKDYKTQIFQTSYCYRVRAYEEDGNTATSLSNVSCTEFRPRMFVPNAFSPNNDGNNDYFQIKGMNLQSLTLTIYDRWGRVAYESKSLDEGWDGTTEGKAAAEGVYMFKLVGLDYEGKPLTYNGSVTLIR
jgi:gliding motility-associated-like protein